MFSIVGYTSLYAKMCVEPDFIFIPILIFRSSYVIICLQTAAQKILTALNAVREQDLDNYCIECMRTERQQWSDDVRSHCADVTPSCGGKRMHH